MSEQNKPTPQQSEEVDLGQLFKLIGNAFQKLYDFVMSIFKSLFNILILLLGHIYKRAKWYGLALVLGLIVGFFLDQTKETRYAANMFIETNFNSSRQAYEVISEFHQLAKFDKDTLELAKKLNITPKEASSLRGFYIEADRDETLLMKDFINYRQELDSLAREEARFKDYKAARASYQFKDHKIGVIATDKFVFKKINDGLVSEFLDNDYINSLRETALANLDRQERVIDLEIKSLDSLLNTYLDIRKRESEKEFTNTSQGTNFYMSGVEKSDLIKDETEIVNKISNLESQKQALALQRVENQQQVNIIANFPDSGYEIIEWTDNYKFTLPIAFIGIVVFVFCFLGLGKFLKTYDTKETS